MQILENLASFLLATSFASPRLYVYIYFIIYKMKLAIVKYENGFSTSE